MTEKFKINIDNVTGVILSGGRATRMNIASNITGSMAGKDNLDKGLISLNSKLLINYVIESLAPQVSDIIINANRNIEQYKQFNYRIVPDQNADYMGPLSGILAVLKACRTDYIVTAPCDSPLLSRTLVNRMLDNMTENTLIPCVAHDGNRLQPLFTLLHKELVNNLEHFLTQGERKAEIWYKNLNPIIVDFSDQVNSFTNINTPEDIVRVEQSLLL